MEFNAIYAACERRSAHHGRRVARPRWGLGAARMPWPLRLPALSLPPWPGRARHVLPLSHRPWPARVRSVRHCARPAPLHRPAAWPSTDPALSGGLVGQAPCAPENSDPYRQTSTNLHGKKRKERTHRQALAPEFRLSLGGLEIDRRCLAALVLLQLV